jgi:hypothetical protein
MLKKVEGEKIKMMKDKKKKFLGKPRVMIVCIV